MGFLSLIQRGIPIAQRARQLQGNIDKATSENAQDLLATARRRVHKRTHRTEESLSVHMDSPTEGKLTGKYGSYWEEYVNNLRFPKSAPHDFAKASLEEVKP